MPTMKQVQRKARKKIKAITNNTKTRYGVVVSNEQNGGAQNPFVNVRDDQSGQLLPNVTNAFSDLSQGTKVELLGRGRAGSEAWSIVRPVRYTKGQRGGNPSAIINTPSLARVATGLHAIVNGTPYFFLRIAIWQIQEQYRNGQRVNYEVEIQKSGGDSPALTLRSGEHRQMGAALLVELPAAEDNGMSLTQIVTAPEVPRPEYFFYPYGAVDILGEVIFHDSEGVDELNTLLREQDTPEGVPTSDVDHDAGEFVLARTVMVSTINLAANTAYRYRVRAIIGDKTSNFSDWETVTTAYDTTVPGWSVTPTPVITNVSGAFVATWDAVDTNVAHFLDYQVQTASDAAFTVNVANAYTRSTQYTFSQRIGQQGFLRVRPRNTSFQVGAWSNTARIAAGLTREPVGTNLIANPSAATNTSNWTHSTGGTGGFTRDTSVYFEAAGSFKIAETRSGIQIPLFVTSSVMAVTGGREYYLRLYCLQQNLTASDLVYVTVNHKASSGGATLFTTTVNVAGATIGATDWTAITLPVFFGSGITHCEVVVGATIDAGSGGVSIWYDDVYLAIVTGDISGNRTRETNSILQSLPPTRLMASNGATTEVVLSGSDTLDFPNMTTGTTSDLTITIAGAVVGDSCVVVPHTTPESGLTWAGWVSASNTVTVRMGNGTGGSINPASRTWSAYVRRLV